MAKYCLLLFILIIGVIIPGTSTSSLVISPNYTPTADSITNSTSEFSIPVNGSGSRENDMILEGNSFVEFDSIEYQSHVELQLIDGYQDSINYQTEFGQQWNMGLGSLQSYWDENDLSTTVSKTDGIYNSSYKMNTNLPVFASSKLVVTLDFLEFNILEEDLGYFALVFKFDTVVVNIMYNITASYEMLLNNQDGNINIIWENTGELILDLTELTEQFQVTYPSQLLQVSVGAYLNRAYSIEARFGKILLLRPISNVTLNNYTISSVTSEISIEENHNISLLVPADHYIKLHTTRYYDFSQDFNFNINLDDVLDLFGNTTIEPLKPVAGFKHTIPYADTFAGCELTGNVQYNSSHFWYYDNVSEEIITYCQFKLTANMPVDSQSQQNTWWRLSLPEGNWKSLHIQHQISNDWRQLNVSKNEIEIFIPLHWSKSKLHTFVFDKNGSYIYLSGQLSLSPARLLSSSRYEVTSTQDHVIPVLLENITSSEQFRPTAIISQLNDTFRNIDGQQGIFIQAGEFKSGTIEFQVNATHPEYIPVIFTLVIDIINEEINVDIEVKRYSRDQTELGINLPQLNNWSIGVNLSITGEGINETHRLTRADTSYILSHPNTGDTGFNLTLIFHLDNNLGDFTLVILVPRWDVTDSASTENEGSQGLITTLSVISISGLIGSVGFKIYQIKFGEKTISF